MTILTAQGFSVGVKNRGTGDATSGGRHNICAGGILGTIVGGGNGVMHQTGV